jgi:hypothetical protein
MLVGGVVIVAGNKICNVCIALFVRQFMKTCLYCVISSVFL